MQPLMHDRSRPRGLPFRWRIAASFLAVLLFSAPPVVYLEEAPELHGNISICGSCPAGYGLYGHTSDPVQCGADQPLAHCVPLGAPILSVCGACPDGYVRIGTSYQPARCGNAEAGNMSQCQLAKLEGGIVGPGKGGVFCPPTCVVPGPPPPPPVYMR